MPLPRSAFVRAARAVTVGASFLFAANALAEEPAPVSATGTAEVERVIVTGSNIPTAQEVGPNPVLILNRDFIDKSGQRTTTTDLLKIQPIANANSVPVQNNATGVGGPTGAASVSLRGFDAQATLVLIDGRRVAPYPGSGFFDLNTIPLPAVQDIEILKDGASATYGADAVAGVVNIKLYKDYRGAQLTLYYGNTLDKDAGLYSGDILFGTGDDKTSITGDIFFFHHNSMFNRDRGNSNHPFILSSNSVPYNFQVSGEVAAAAGGPNLAPVEFTTPPDNSNGQTPATDWNYGKNRVRGPFDLLPGFNFNAFSSSYPEQERWGGYTAFEHKVCDDQLRVFGDFYYADVKQHDELAPPATGNWEAKGTITLYIPPNHPFQLDANGVPIAPPNTPTAAEVGMPANAYNPFNPFQQIISGGTNARLFEFGNRLIDVENIAELFTVGVKGDKLFNGTWGYDGAFRYSQILDIYHIRDASVSRFNRIMNAADSIYDPTSSEFIGATIPFNPFGDSLHNPIPNNSIPIAFATIRRKDLSTSKLASADLNIYTTDLFDLPAGGVGLAFGGSFRRETLTIDPDDSARLGDEAGVGLTPPSHSGRKEYAFYGETLIPVFSPAMSVAGFHSLEFSAAARFEEWENNDTNALVPKVGVRWQPFDEQFTVRSTWGEGFREPSLFELFGARSFGLVATSFHGNVNEETNFELDANPLLAPERSRNWSGGVVYTPKWIPAGQLTVTVDLWDIEREGVVTPPTAQDVVSRFISGHLLRGEEVVLDPLGTSVTFVRTNFQNAGRENARGVDLGIQYQLPTRYGTFTSLTQVTYLDSFIFQFPGEKAREVAGRVNGDWFESSHFAQQTGADAWFKWKGTSRLDWTWHNFDLNWTVHYTDGFWEQIYAKQFDGFWKQHWVPHTWFFDAQTSYDITFIPPVEPAPVPGYSKDSKAVGAAVSSRGPQKTVSYSMPCWKTVLNNTRITVGVNNIFGQRPPTSFGFELFNTALKYPGFSYDNLGRFVYVELKKKF
jgi:iron complex outermembrane recepter protein